MFLEARHAAGKQAHASLVEVRPYAPVLAIAVQAKERKDDVKLGAAFTKLTEEDPSLSVVHKAESHEVVIWGQGEMHLRVAAERLGDRYAVPVTTRPPTVGYRETIRKPISIRGRHKKQSGGHGQFGDTVLEIRPLPRSSGFKFEDKITGGVVPRNYIPAVEEGIIDGLKHGPLGFPVVDLAVALVKAKSRTQSGGASVGRSSAGTKRTYCQSASLGRSGPFCSRNWRSTCMRMVPDPVLGPCTARASSSGMSRRRSRRPTS